jgi:ABC-type branched-subunit amino acid transport system substrate-binding protein
MSIADPLVACLMTAVAALAATTVKLYADNKELNKEVKEGLIERAEKAETASERLAEASKLSRETQSILKSGRY